MLGKLKNAEIKIEGLEITEKTTNEEIRKGVLKNLDKEEFKSLKSAMEALKEKTSALSNKVKEVPSVKQAATDCWNAVADKVKDVKVPRTKMLLIGGAVAGVLLGLLTKPKSKEQV